MTGPSSPTAGGQEVDVDFVVRFRFEVEGGESRAFLDIFSRAGVLA
jgi:hypothetical protein